MWIGVGLSKTNLNGADLSSATPVIADLSGADLRRTNLSYAIVNGADLSSAILSEAIGWTKEQLLTASSLKGATMPNGQKYEDWLKDKKVINCHRDLDFSLDVKKLKYKEGRGENGEDSSAS
jgi:uncharacterized protein YjbI with pentapeptide repeats